MNLYEIVNPVKINTLKRLNKLKKWQYGYNKDHDIVVISKNGTIGDIYEIQGLKIALPKKPKKVHTFKNNTWQVETYPKELNRIKTIFDWRDYPQSFKNKYIDYIENEFKKRDEYLWEFKLKLSSLITSSPNGVFNKVEIKKFIWQVLII